jgi:hypothetical protein
MTIFSVVPAALPPEPRKETVASTLPPANPDWTQGDCVRRIIEPNPDARHLVSCIQCQI